MKKILLSTLLLSLPLLSYAQQRFPSPDDAATAFATAVATQNEAQLTALLGDNWRQFLPQEGADPESAPASSLRVYPLPYRLKRPLLCKCSPFLP